jgi:hypothetical protein
MVAVVRDALIPLVAVFAPWVAYILLVGATL